MGYGGNAQCQGQAFLLPFQGRVFLLLPFCKQNASLQQLLSHMATVCLSTHCPKNDDSDDDGDDDDFFARTVAETG